MTSHALDQLPLWVEGDLDASGMARVDQHLAACAACRLAAEDLRRGQARLREAMASPFEAADHARLRGRVMDQLQAEAARPPTRRFAPRPFHLAAAAAALLLVALPWLQRPRSQAHPGQRPSPPGPGTRAEIPPDPTSLPTRRAAPRLVPSPPRPGERIAEPEPPEGPSRIEFQTADPTIRIIWLARATPLPEAEPTLQEAP